MMTFSFLINTFQLLHFRKLNAELEAKTANLVAEAEEVLVKSFWVSFKFSVLLSMSKTIGWSQFDHTLLFMNSDEGWIISYCLKFYLVDFPFRENRNQCYQSLVSLTTSILKSSSSELCKLLSGAKVDFSPSTS